MTKINLGSGKDYREGYLNVDIDSKWKPDVVIDIGGWIPWFQTELPKDTFDEILCNDVLEHIPNLVQAMTNCLALLRTGGIMDITAPYDLSLGAWADPTHVRAFNQKSWIYYCEWSWYLGWETHRFHLRSINFVMEDGYEFTEDCLYHPRTINSMRVILEKVALTPEEKEACRKYRNVDR